MPTLLHIDSSPLQSSVTRELTHEFADTWQKAHPGATVIYRNLAANPPTLLDAFWIQSAYADPASRTPEQKAALALSDELIAELEQADEYVLGVAMHNFSIPSVLRLWIDQIARRGRTFAYGANGPEGLLKGKKATLLCASGGSYDSGSPSAAMNFAEPYLRAVLGFLGVTDVKVVKAGGAARIATGAVDRATFLKPILERVRAIAA